VLQTHTSDTCLLTVITDMLSQPVTLQTRQTSDTYLLTYSNYWYVISASDITDPSDIRHLLAYLL